MIDLKKITDVAPNAFSGRSVLRSVLLDQYPEQRRMINVITLILECGISDKIKTAEKLDEYEIVRLCSQLEREYGITAQYSREPLIIWANFYSIPVIPSNTLERSLPKRFNSVQEPREYVPPQRSPIVHATITHQDVSGNLSDFEIEPDVDEGGWSIVKFIGFDRKEIQIPNIIDGKSIKKVGENAFADCHGIEQIVVSEGIERIGNGAFHGCSELKKVELPESLKKLGTPVDKNRQKNEYGVFQGCPFSTISLPSGLQVLGYRAFRQCWKLKEINLPNSIEVLEEGAFCLCKSLANVLFPDQLQVIETESFYGCNALRKIELPYSLQCIADNAFRACYCLQSILIPQSVTEIGNGNFDHIPNLTILCYANSYAMQYAREHKFRIKDAATI